MRKIENTKMSVPLVIVVIFLGFLMTNPPLLIGEEGLIDDFESGVGQWKGATITAVSDAKVGSGAARLSFAAAKKPRNILKKISAPVGYTHLTFWLKGDGSNQTVGVMLKSAWPKAYWYISKPLSLADTQWTKVELNFNDFIVATSVRENLIEEPMTSHLDKIEEIVFTVGWGQHAERSFIIDQIQFEKIVY